jgi:hypothetical protein
LRDAVSPSVSDRTCFAKAKLFFRQDLQGFLIYKICFAKAKLFLDRIYKILGFTTFVLLKQNEIYRICRYKNLVEPRAKTL